MLDLSFSATVNETIWGAVSSQAVLPESSEDFFAEQGAAPMGENTRRRYRRVFVRGRGIVVRGDNRYGAYTIDVSPMGIGFFAPVQLLPKEKIGLFFEEHGLIQLVLRRCVRSAPQCYSCGGTFADGPLTPGAYRRFLDQLRS